MSDVSFPRVLPNPDLPASRRAVESQGGVETTSDTIVELLEIEWVSGDRLEVEIGAADAYVRIRVGDHEPSRLTLRRGAESDLTIGMGAGYGPGVHPFAVGDSGHLRFIEIVGASRNSRFRLDFAPGDRLLLCDTFCRFAGGQVCVVEPVSIFDGSKAVFRVTQRLCFANAHSECLRDSPTFLSW